jgi:Cutinase
VLYGASLATNVSPARTDAKSIQTGVTAFQRAAKACPIIVAGGYSQGAAVMHNVISKRLSADIKSRIAGVVLYGDTRNKQDRGRIPNFPADKVKVFCNKNDGVCGGMLVVNGGHLAYAGQIGAGASFLAERVKEFRSAGGGSSSGSSGNSNGSSSGGEDGGDMGDGGDGGEGGKATEAPASGLLGKLGGLGKAGKAGKRGKRGKSGGLLGKLGGGGEAKGGLLGKLGGGGEAKGGLLGKLSGGKRGGGSGGGLSGLLGKLGGGS